MLIEDTVIWVGGDEWFELQHLFLAPVFLYINSDTAQILENQYTQDQLYQTWLLTDQVEGPWIKFDIHN